MKKSLLLLGIVASLGLAFFAINNDDTSITASSKANDGFVVWGEVDFSDDKEEAVETTSAKQSEDDKGLEHFIKTHQTPLSKTIYK